MDTSASFSIDYDYVVDVVGFLAGLLVSVALLPQIYRAHQRKSAKDLSTVWQGIIAVGVTMQLVYLAYFSLWSVFVPLTGELIFILYLTGFKTFLEMHSPEGAEAVRGEDPTTTDIPDELKLRDGDTKNPDNHDAKERTAEATSPDRHSALEGGDSGTV